MILKLFIHITHYTIILLIILLIRICDAQILILKVCSQNIRFIFHNDSIALRTNTTANTSADDTTLLLKFEIEIETSIHKNM